MKVGRDKMVAMDYTLRLSSGEVADSSEGGSPLEFIFGTGDLISGLEHELEGLEAGADKEFVISPEDGYGERDPAMVMDIPADRFPKEIQLETGAILYAKGPEGQNLPFTVVDIMEDSVTVDFNHPLAGEQLYFTVAIRSVRNATPEELLQKKPPRD
ncbi:MAG: peptidylprolyl isomerase [Candidatus Methylomirabilales bacterium]